MDAISGDQGGGPKGLTQGVLRSRLLAAAPVRAAVLPPPVPPSLERAAATATARAASRAQGLQVLVGQVDPGIATLAELPELLPEGALLAVVEGAGDRLGVVALCPAVLASLIEMQALGRISARAAHARRATRTDATLAAEFVNLLLGELAGALNALPLGEAMAGLRYASYLDDPRPLGLMLDDGSFHSLRLGLRLGPQGERTGSIFLAVPGAAEAAVAAGVGSASEAEPQVVTQAGAGRRTLAEAVRLAPVALEAVLCRKSITLRELRGLQPGATLALPRSALEEVTVETGSGQVVAQGRLGEADGFFAVRLSDGGDASALPTDRLPLGTAEPPMADLDAPDSFRHDALGAGFDAMPMAVGLV